MTSLGWPQLLLLWILGIRLSAHVAVIFFYSSVKYKQRVLESIGGLLGFLVSGAILLTILYCGGFFSCKC